MNAKIRVNTWLVICLIGMLLISCQLGTLSISSSSGGSTETSLAAGVIASLTSNSETEAAKVTPTQPEPTKTATPTVTPTPQPSSTPKPSPTKRPTSTKVKATNTPGLTKVTVKNNMNVLINLILIGPIQKSFSVQSHSSFSFEAPPGMYTFKFKATNFYPQEGNLFIPPGEFTWTWGKAK
jgi:hypothetical protein